MKNIGKTSQSSLKVCGICRLEDLRLCLKMRVPYLGFNFFEGSKRYLTPNHAKDLWNQCVDLNCSTELVGVFVNSGAAEIVRACLEFPELGVVQLHGSETASFIRQLAGELPPQVRIWKALAVKETADLQAAATFGGAHELILLDGKNPGSGARFDWALLSAFQTEAALVGLAGGIGVDNIVEALQFLPDVVDVASGCETKPREKDPDKIRTMMKAVEVANKSRS